jgi:asparagine synthetase B (glutamine-hydrolysing)
LQILDTLSKMCGIFMCLSEDEASGEDLLQTLASSLKNRGPDNAKEIRLQIKLDSGKTVHATFLGCVLWLRGAEMTKQPLVDSENNVLLWNGDIFEGDILKSDSHGKYSDTEILSKKLQSLPDEQIHAVSFSGVGRTRNFSGDPKTR